MQSMRLSKSIGNIKALGCRFRSTKRAAAENNQTPQSGKKNLVRSELAPIDFTTSNTQQLFENLEEYKCRRILIEGVYDHENEIVLGLRTAPAGLLGPAAQGLASNPQGNFIITPLVLNDGNIIYVNRGWISRATTTWDRPEGKITLQALVTETEPGSFFSPPNDIKTRKFFWFEKKALIDALQLSPRIDENALSRFREQRHFVIVDAVENEIDMKGTGPFPKLPQIINQHYAQPITHLTYAFTWASLTVIGGYMTYLKFRK